MDTAKLFCYIPANWIMNNSTSYFNHAVCTKHYARASKDHMEGILNLTDICPIAKKQHPRLQNTHWMCLSHSWHKLYSCVQMMESPKEPKNEGRCRSSMILELTALSMGLPHQPNALDNRFVGIVHFSESCGEPMWQR